MRIAVNTRLLLKDRMEGIGWYTYEILRILVKKHPEDEFIFFFDRPFDKSFVLGPNVTPLVLFPPARHPILFVWWFEWSVSNALKKFKPDVFFSPDNFTTLRTDVKTVLVTHDLAHAHFPSQLTWVQRKYYQFFVPRFNRKADRIVTVSNYTKDDIIRTFGISPEKISVSYNGCKEGFKPLDETQKVIYRNKYAEGQPYFLYVGAIHPRKNVHRLIAAFDLFKVKTGSNAKLLIAGGFAWKSSQVVKACEKARFQQDVLFLGYVSYSDLCGITGSAFCSVYISSFEGFGVPLIEAMNCDVPLISSTLTSMPEIAGNAGLLVNPESVQEVANAMSRIWENQNLRNDLIAEGRRQKEKFSWQYAADIVYENLKLAAGQKR